MFSFVSLFKYMHLNRIPTSSIIMHLKFSFFYSKTKAETNLSMECTNLKNVKGGILIFYLHLQRLREAGLYCRTLTKGSNSRK